MNFTYDLVTKHIAHWEKWLAEFKDKPACALEIGSFEGKSAIWFCQNILTHEKSRLMCVDTFSWLNSRAAFESNVKEAGLESKISVKQMSSQWLQLPSDSMDFIYVDGSHAKQRVLLDAVLSWRTLKKGGIIIFDDYLLNRNGQLEIKIACDAFLSVHADSVEIVGHGYQLAMRRMA